MADIPIDVPAGIAGGEPLPAKPKRYVPALGPKMKVFLAFIFAGVALLGATGIYLFALRVLELTTSRLYQTHTSMLMLLGHTLIGVVFMLPFVIFGVIHLTTARQRTNRRAVRLGITLFMVSLVVGLTGLALVQLAGMPQLRTDSVERSIVLWLHILTPVLAVGVYIWHRKAGPKIRWRWGGAWGAAVAIFVAVMAAMHSHVPRSAKGSPEGEKYYEPSKARTADGKFVAVNGLMMDEYCRKCHEDIYQQFNKSAHKFSSFNNPAYLHSVRETRKRVGTRAARWCAGCHDTVPLFGGEFDDPDYDDVKNPTAHAGITCTTCHSITHVASRSGNADYTIEEAMHYPFAFSDNAVLQWLNNQLIKAKPDLHKRTFLKDTLHRTADFCSTCHKVGLPQEVNHYKEFLRGQNHPDSYHLSGVSGHGARSWYYPDTAKTKCADCHMPLVASNDFGSRDFDGSGIRKVHNHSFFAANSGIHALVKYPGWEDSVKEIEKFLTGGPDGKSPPLRIDLFGLKRLETPAQGVEAPLLSDQPLRPNLPKLEPGKTYLVEVVIRTLNMGHHFTQGTADSNEVWVDFTAKAGGKIVARNGGLSGNEEGEVDPGAHFLNVLMLDRHGNRIDRRNPQDIFTPLYDHQIPPGAAQVVHYRVTLPPDLKEPVELSARVRYRKFDHKYMEIVHGKGKVPRLPIIDICSDKVVLPVAGGKDVPAQESPIKAAWQRWNDYGIGCFLEGGPDGKKGGELAMAEKAFQRLLSPEFKEVKEAHGHGHLNLARVHLAYGGDVRLEQARLALIEARKCDPPAPWQTVAWFNGVVNMQHVNFDEAIAAFEQILDPKNNDPRRKFDFSGDFVVRNELGKALFGRAQEEEAVFNDPRQPEDVRATARRAWERFLRRSIEKFEKVLELDAEDIIAHEYLNKVFARLEPDESAFSKELVLSPTAAEQRLRELAKVLADGGTGSRRRVEAANELLRALDESEAAAGTAPPAMPVILEVRRKALRAATVQGSSLVGIAAGPVVNRLDRWLLKQVPRLGKMLADESFPREQRLEAGALLAVVVADLGERLPPSESAALLWATTVPSPGLPVNLALTGMAQKGQLQGGLPPPRLLVLQALRQQVRPLFDRKSDTELAATAARVLARTHLVFHGIFKPDDNAQDHAVRVYRRQHPLADRASHSIVIYPAN
jgi:tetratricopeptide (TPR) repeat protein